MAKVTDTFLSLASPFISSLTRQSEAADLILNKSSARNVTNISANRVCSTPHLKASKFDYANPFYMRTMFTS